MLHEMDKNKGAHDGISLYNTICISVKKVISPTNFWAQITRQNKQNNEDFSNLIQAIQDFYNDSNFSKARLTDPLQGKRCVVRTDERKWRRAVIEQVLISRNGFIINCILVDDVEEKVFTVRSVYDSPPWVWELPPQSACFGLYGIAPAVLQPDYLADVVDIVESRSTGKWDPASTKYFKEQCESHPELVAELVEVDEKDVHLVRLLVPGTIKKAVCINDEMLARKLAVVKSRGKHSNGDFASSQNSYESQDDGDYLSPMQLHARRERLVRLLQENTRDVLSLSPDEDSDEDNSPGSMALNSIGRGDCAQEDTGGRAAGHGRPGQVTPAAGDLFSNSTPTETFVLNHTALRNEGAALATHVNSRTDLLSPEVELMGRNSFLLDPENVSAEAVCSFVMASKHKNSNEHQEDPSGKGHKSRQHFMASELQKPSEFSVVSDQPGDQEASCHHYISEITGSTAGTPTSAPCKSRTGMHKRVVRDSVATSFLQQACTKILPAVCRNSEESQSLENFPRNRAVAKGCRTQSCCEIHETYRNSKGGAVRSVSMQTGVIEELAITQEETRDAGLQCDMDEPFQPEETQRQMHCNSNFQAAQETEMVFNDNASGLKARYGHRSAPSTDRTSVMPLTDIHGLPYPMESDFYIKAPRVMPPCEVIESEADQYDKLKEDVQELKDSKIEKKESSPLRTVFAPDNLHSGSVIFVRGKNPPNPISLFCKAPFPSYIKRLLEEHLLKGPLLIQAYAWPAILTKRDVLAIAPCGGGKTIAYTVPIAAMLLNDGSRTTEDSKQPKAVIVTTNWTDANSIHLFMLEFLAQHGDEHNVVAVYGGSPAEDAKASEIASGCSVLICTAPSLVRICKAKYIDFSRMKHLIFDDINILAEEFMDELGDILKYRANSMMEITANLLPYKPSQVICMGSQWTSRVQSFLDEVMLNQPLLLISHPLEAAVYGNVQHRVIASHKFDFLGHIFNILDHWQAHRQGGIVVFVKTPKDVDRLHKIIQSKGFSCQKAHSDMCQGELDNLRREFEEDRCKPVLIATDDVILELDIYNFQVVVHQSLPTDQHSIGVRLSVMQSFFHPKSQEVDRACAMSYFLVMKDDAHLLPSLAKFLKRVDQEVSEELAEFVALHEKGTDELRSPLCPSLKSFGHCRDQAVCPHRHLISNVDRPNKESRYAQIPTSGHVCVTITHIEDATHYCGRLAAVRTGGADRPIVKYAPVHAQITMDLTMHFRKAGGASFQTDPVLGKVYALSDSFDRVCITPVMKSTTLHKKDMQEWSAAKSHAYRKKLICWTTPGGSRKTYVRLVDSGSYRVVRCDQLLEIPPKFANIPFQCNPGQPGYLLHNFTTQRVPPSFKEVAILTCVTHQEAWPVNFCSQQLAHPDVPAISVRACGVKPIDKDTEWLPQANEFANSQLCNKVIEGNVVVALGSTIWLHPLVIRSKLSVSNRTVTDLNITHELVKMKFAEKNPDQLKFLTGLNDADCGHSVLPNEDRCGISKQSEIGPLCSDSSTCALRRRVIRSGRNIVDTAELSDTKKVGVRSTKASAMLVASQESTTPSLVNGLQAGNRQFCQINNVDSNAKVSESVESAVSALVPSVGVDSGKRGLDAESSLYSDGFGAGKSPNEYLHLLGSLCEKFVMEADGDHRIKLINEIHMRAQGCPYDLTKQDMEGLKRVLDSAQTTQEMRVIIATLGTLAEDQVPVASYIRILPLLAAACSVQIGIEDCQKRSLLVKEMFELCQALIESFSTNERVKDWCPSGDEMNQMIALIDNYLMRNIGKSGEVLNKAMLTSDMLKAYRCRQTTGGESNKEVSRQKSLDKTNNNVPKNFSNKFTTGGLNYDRFKDIDTDNTDVDSVRPYTPVCCQFDTAAEASTAGTESDTQAGFYGL